MATILTKKKDTTGAPVAGDLTNSSGGAELAVNTADKRLYTKDSGGNVVEVGTNPGTAVTFTAGTVSAPAITTTGDTNTGVFFPAADTIAFAEGGAEAMRINSDSQVVTTAGTASLPAITTTGDVNTGIFFPAADTIAFAEGGAEAMRIDSSGNVGIGTTATSGYGKLNIDGDLYFGGTAGASYKVWNRQGGSLIFGTNDTERMRIDSSGNVGIGTSSPAFKLDISGGGTTAKINTLDTHDGGASLSTWMKVGRRAGTGTNAYINTLHSGSDAVSALTLAFGTSGTGTEVMRIDSSGNVGIGTSSPSSYFSGATNLVIGNASGDTGMTISSGTSSLGRILFADGTSGSAAYQGWVYYTHADNAMSFATAGSERARITSDGDFMVARTSASLGNAGFLADNEGYVYIERSAAPVLYVNRLTNDGTLVGFYQATILEGEISVSGNTVTYGSFSGGHWSQLQQGRGYNPEILRGTVMSSIGEMAEWKSVIWDEVIEHPAVPAVEAKEAVLDEEGNVVEPAVEAVEGKDAWTETNQRRENYLGNLAVGATFTEDGVTKTVVDDGNERLPKVKISDVVGDKAVYGVFQTWDEAQDMMVVGLGAFVVRIAAGVTVQIGDLLESNGDGCAKVQDDDVIRSKTIGKVTSITPSATYADGSYTVPAVLYCG